MKKLLILLFSILISFNSYSEIYYGEYNKNPSNYDDYVNGLQLGMSWYGVAIMDENPSAKRYCKSGVMELELNNIHTIINSQVERFINDRGLDQATIDDVPISLILLMGLEFTFPCN
jgi:hypothetical protein